MFYFAGAASVIIALTDGELNDYQFVTAQQEASTQASDATMDVAFSLLPVIISGMCLISVLTTVCVALLCRQGELGLWEPSYTVWV